MNNKKSLLKKGEYLKWLMGEKKVQKRKYIFSAQSG
jgi:hypothetical protein